MSLICASLICINQAWAAEPKPKLKMSPEPQQQGWQQEQLEKARKAAGETQSREQKVLKRQQYGEWEQAQKDKARQAADARTDREQKYLKQARDAAAKERKIAPKSDQ